MKKIASEISGVISDISDLLPAEDIHNALEFVKYGEWGEALDLVCTQLYEYEVEISEELHSKILKIYRNMNENIDRWKCLEELVSS